MQLSDFIVDVAELTKSYRHPTTYKELMTLASPGEALAVDRVSLRVQEGEVFGLVGPNGAGKTTLIKMLCTLLIPSAGRASICGYDLLTKEQQVKSVIGLVTSNERSFYWRLTGRQNMRFFAALYKIPQKEGEKWIQELFELLDLREVADIRFDSYSTGFRQRLALARGLLNRPRVLFMDEPTKGVDPLAAFSLIDLIRDRIVNLWKQTVVVTSHNLREIEQLCGRIAIMNHGKVVACGTVQELRSSVIIHETYILVIKNLKEQHLQHIGLLVDGMARPPKIVSANGGILLELKIIKDSQAFSNILKYIIKNDGDVVGCQTVDTPLEEIFRSVVQSSKGGKDS